MNSILIIIEIIFILTYIYIHLYLIFDNIINIRILFNLNYFNKKCLYYNIKNGK